MSPDPNLFLSTIAAASAALVAIIGGLLVARFVGLDSDQRASRRAHDAADGRLKTARERASVTHSRVVRWEARGFLAAEGVMGAIFNGQTDLVELRAIADCPLNDDDLRVVVTGTAQDIDAAKQAIATNPPSEDELTDTDGWDAYRKRVAGTSDSRPWRAVFLLKADELEQERERQRREQQQRRREQQQRRREQEQRRGRGAAQQGLIGLPRLRFPELGRLAFNFPPLPDYGTVLPKMVVPPSAISARRRDEIYAEDERAQQRVDDYERELERIDTEHAQIAGPTGWLWAAVVILIVFAGAGIGLPIWEMSRGPTSLSAVNWVMWPFFGALSALLGYMCVYLKKLTRKDQAG